MTRYAEAAKRIGISRELEKYLESHPEVSASLRRAQKAEELFSGFLRLAGSRIIVRDVAGGSTAEADFDAAVSPTDF